MQLYEEEVRITKELRPRVDAAEKVANESREAKRKVGIVCARTPVCLCACVPVCPCACVPLCPCALVPLCPCARV